MLKTTIPLALLFLVVNACNIDKASSDADTETPTALAVVAENNQFKDYWYQNKAELTSFNLEQARYGELHKGKAVLIYVTEEFSKSKQVKLDDPSAYPKDAVPILKLNSTKKFNTGIYPYSIMQSVFTPVDGKKWPNSLKVTTSSQEWCGHTYTQLNLKNKQYKIKQLSYFESEGDQNFSVPNELLEDEVWTKIRIAPKSLPTGMVKMIPSSVFARLRHTTLKVQTANTRFEENTAKGWLSYYIEYPALERNLVIHIDKDFPHEIQGWEESAKSGFGPNAKILTTKAVRDKSMMLDYWRHHDNADLELRAQLGLD